MTGGDPARLTTAIASLRLPATYSAGEFVASGGLMSYGPNYPGLFRRAAYYVDKILRGANPAEFPVEEPTVFDLAINLKTAKALGLTVPPVAARYRRRGDRINLSQCGNLRWRNAGLGHERPICDGCAMSASPPKATAALRRTR